MQEEYKTYLIKLSVDWGKTLPAIANVRIDNKEYCFCDSNLVMAKLQARKAIDEYLEENKKYE